VKKYGVSETPYSLKEKSEAPQAAKLTLFGRLSVDSIAGIALVTILTSSPGPQKFKNPSIAGLFRALCQKKTAEHTIRAAVSQHDPHLLYGISAENQFKVT
jgi:hypothetical protein